MSEEEVAVLIERLDNLKQSFDKSEERAEEWRLRFMEKLDAKPCEQHSSTLKSIDSQLKWMWGIVAALVVAILSKLLGV